MNNHKDSTGYKVFTVINTIFFVFVGLSMLLPLVNLMAVSLSSSQPILAGHVWFWPIDMHFENYAQLFSNGAVPRALFVTIYITVVGTLLNLFFTGITAYPLAKIDLVGRSTCMFLIVFTMIFGAPLIPNYLLVKSLGLINSLWAVMIPGLISAFYMILVRTFYMGLPAELFDASRIDGCSEWRILWQIAFPLSVPVFATVGLFYSVGHWNTYTGALLYLHESRLYTLQLLLRQMIQRGEVDSLMDTSAESTEALEEGLVAAAVMIATVPILCVYPFLQKYFIKGSLIGSVK